MDPEPRRSPVVWVWPERRRAPANGWLAVFNQQKLPTDSQTAETALHFQFGILVSSKNNVIILDKQKILFSHLPSEHFSLKIKAERRTGSFFPPASASI